MALFRNAATVFTTSVVAIPLGFAANLILARYLSVADRGTYGLAQTFGTMVYMAVQVGLPLAVIFERRRHGSPPARLMTSHLAACVAMGLVGTAICFAIPDALRERLLPGVDSGVIALIAWTVPWILLAEFLRAVARSLDRFDLQNWSSVLYPVALVAALAGALILAGGGLRAALWSNLAVQAVLCGWVAAALMRETGLERRIVPREIARAVTYGASSYGQGLLLYVQERLEVFLIAYLLEDSVQLGLYAVALSASNPFRLIPSSLAMAVFPDLAEREPASAAATVATLTRHSVFFTVLLCALALPFMPWLVPAFFGHAYAAAVPAVMCLLPGVCVLSASRLLARYFQAVDQQRVLLASRLAAVAANGGLGWLWIQSGGIAGAALASLAAGVVEATVIAAAFVATSGVGARELFLPRRSDLEPYRWRAREVIRKLRARA